MDTGSGRPRNSVPVTDERELGRLIASYVADLAGLQPDEVEADRSLADYGLSSRDGVTLAGYLETLIREPLPATVVWEQPTLGDLARFLARRCDPATAAPARAGPVAEPVAAPSAAGTGDQIALIGVGCRFPGGPSGALTHPGALWRFLRAGGNAVREVPAQRWSWFWERSGTDPAAFGGLTRWAAVLDDVDGFDAKFFGISPGEATTMDPQQRMLLEVSWEAFEHAGLPPRSLAGSRTGVFAGISAAEYAHLTTADPGKVDAWTATGVAPSVAAGRISYLLDLRGPTMAVDTACSSSLVAVHLAAASLRARECDLAIAGGVNLLLSPVITMAFDAGGGTSPDGQCRPFDVAANGMVRGEGCGMVVLKRLADARRDGDRVLAILAGSAVGSDGRSNGLVAPNGEAQRDLLRRAYEVAGVDPATVGYVETHGTGTPLGDPIEARALGEVLGGGRSADRPLLIGSVKGNIGHLEAAAGVAGLVKAVLALSHLSIPPSANFTQPSPHIAFRELALRVPTEQVPWPGGATTARAGVSAFGFSGTNAHLVLEAPDEQPGPGGEAGTGRPVSFSLSDISPARIRDQAGQLAGWLNGTELADVAATLTRRAGRGRHRSIAVARDRDEMTEALAALHAGRPHPAVVSGTGAVPETGTVFVFSGFGSQWPGMGRRLAAEEPVFAAAVDELDDDIRAAAGISLSAAIQTGSIQPGVELAQPVVFGIQVALARLWASYGVLPAAVVGHSMGEVAAAVVSGALTAAEGARVIACRSRLLSRIVGFGAMAVVGLPASEVAGLVPEDVHIAVISSPEQCVVTGDRAAVTELARRVTARDAQARVLAADGAGHSPQVEPLIPPLMAELDGVGGGHLTARFYSSVTADPRTAPRCDAAYWAANMRQPVRLGPALAAAAEDGFRAFVEVSPHPLVGRAIAETLRHGPANGKSVVTGTLRRDTDDVLTFHRQLAALTAAGIATRPLASGTVVDLPPAPWRHERYWPDPPRPVAIAGRDPLPVPHADKLFQRSWEPRQAPARTGRESSRWLLLTAPGHAPQYASVLAGALATTTAPLADATDGLLADRDGVVVLAPEPPVAVAAAERFAADVIRVAAAAARRPGSPPRLWIVTQGLTSDPGLAAVQGLIRVLAIERPALRATVVDADRAETAAAELAAGGPDDEVAWRDGQRLVARLVRAGQTSGSRPVVRPGGSYVITGGYGGLGLEVARWLARRGAGRLVLAGRSGPPASSLDGLAADVRVVRGDVSSPQVADQLLAAAQDGGTSLRGIVHAAGVFGDALVTDVTPDLLARVWAPKARGASALHEAIERAGADPDWVVLFSSAAALLGSPGQAAYAIANAWLDGFARWRTGQGLPTYSIGWGVWDRVGRAADIAIGGIDPLSPQEAIEDLEALLTQERPVTAVLRLDPDRTAAAFPEISAIGFFGSLFAPAGDVAARPGARVRSIVAAVLGLPEYQVHPDLVLADAGLDSLAAQRIVGMLERETGVKLETSVLLTGATLATLQEAAGGDPPPAEPEPHIEPRDITERWVLRVIADVLGADGLGVTHDLRHSGLTDQSRGEIAARLAAETGLQLDPGELLRIPTAEAAAERIRKIRATADAGLMPTIRASSGQDAAPLLLAHPAGEDTGIYKMLAGLLDDDRPVFGIERQPGTVTERARRYSAAISERFPAGSCVLGGWSFGGVLAYETARCLAAAGRRPDLVVLLDAALPLPVAPEDEARVLARRFAAFADYLTRTYGRAVQLREEELAGLAEDDQLALLTERMDASGVTARLSPAMLRHQFTSHEDTRALEGYQAGQYDGPVVLYRADQPTPWAVQDPRYEITDPSRGWAPLCPRLDVIPVDAHHLNLLDPPAVSAVAAHLRAQLAAAGVPIRR